MKKLFINKALFYIILIGIITRALFTLFIAEAYFGRENIYVDGDTLAWLNSFINLIKNGVYTMYPGHEYGYFLRMPGYSFFIGIIYYICGENPDVAFPVIAWVQIILDVCNIYFVYKIGMRLFEKKRIAIVAALIYSLYPFVIVWNPVAYSESLSIFFMLFSLHIFLSESKYRYYLSGILISIAVLCRPQIMLFIPVMFLFIYLKNRKLGRKTILYLAQFGISILIVYGSWPLRNYINYNKIIFTQDLRSAKNWNIDVISFMQYMYSIKSEWEPQFSEIINNKEVIFPHNAYFTKEDSLKLSEAVFLSKNCGSGFSYWKGYWKEHVDDEDCTMKIAQLFTELREHQIKNFPLDFYLLIPLQNLKKAVFKNSLYNTAGIRKYASYLFYYRTLLVIFGLLGGIVLMFQKRKKWTILLLFPVLLYIVLCFGTGVQFRNIEMRYFLPADVILIFPAVFLANKLYNRIKRKAVL